MTTTTLTMYNNTNTEMTEIPYTMKMSACDEDNNVTMTANKADMLVTSTSSQHHRKQ